MDSETNPTIAVEDLETGQDRYAALRKLGCTHGQAIQWANTRKSYWRIANSHILAISLNNDFLKTQGWSWLGLTRVDGYGG